MIGEHWSNWADFLLMGGDAFYVWGAVLVCVILMLAEVFFVYRRKTNIVKKLVKRFQKQGVLKDGA